jgi:DNA-binding transcriptional LysR family regulator
MDTDRLAVFRAVAREGGFSRAAQRLFRTQPAVSQSIRVLEDELGQRLFDRQGRRTTLTPAGRILLEHADEAFAALERARDRMSSLSSLDIGLLRVAASDTTTCYVLPPVLRTFRDRHPGVELRISNRPTPAAVSDVADREADLALVTLPVKRPGLSALRLVAQEDVAVFAPDHPISRRRRIDLGQLARHPLLMLDQRSQTRRWLDALLASESLVPQIAMELGSVEVVKEMAALGFGVGVVPAFAIEHEIAAGVLDSRRFLPRPRVRQLGIVHGASESLSAAARVFVELLRESVGDRGRD